MYRFWKRVISVILCIALVVTLLPQAGAEQVSAADVNPESTAVYNSDIIDALSGIVGGEEKAREYYDMLQSYGLIDDEGNVLDSWDIEKDGKKISLDEIKEILEGEYDPQEIVWVDGTPVTLGELAYMLGIEEYLAYIKDTYFTEKVWTQEQQKNALSLLDQFEKEGIILRTSNETMPVITTGARGVNHNARVTVTHREGTTSNNNAAMFLDYFDVSLTGANPNQTVSFNVKAYSGSIKATISNPLVNLKADANGNKTSTITVIVTKPDPMSNTPLWSSESSYVLNCYGIKNALFSDGEGNDCEALGVVAKCKGTIDYMPNCLSFNIEGNTGLPTDDLVTEQKYIEGPAGGAWANTKKVDEQNKKTGSTVNLTNWQQKFIEWGLIDSVKFVHEKEDLPLNNPSLEFSPDNVNGVISQFAEWATIQADNDAPGEGVQVSVSLPGTAFSHASGTPSTWKDDLLRGRGRQVQAATYQFIVNRSDGSNETEWYNYSVGYRPEANSNADYITWNWDELLPAGGHDMAKDSKNAEELKKGDVIKSLTFDGGMAYYPLKIYKKHTGMGMVHTFWPTDYGYMLYSPNTAWDYSFFRADLYDQYATIQEIWPFAGKNYPITAAFSRKEDAEIQSITVPDGTFLPGELVPITVRYSEPAKASTVMIVNDKILASVEKTASNVQTFLWKVEENGEASLDVRGFADKNDLFAHVSQYLQNTIKDCKDEATRKSLTQKLGRVAVYQAKSNLSGLADEIDFSRYNLNGLAAKNLDGNAMTNITVAVGDETLSLGGDNFKIDPVSKLGALTGMTLSLNLDDPSHPRIKAELAVTDDEQNYESSLTWLDNDFNNDSQSLPYSSQSFKIKIAASDGSFVSDYLDVKVYNENAKGGVLSTDEVEIPVNDTGDYLYYTAELYAFKGDHGPKNPTPVQLNAVYNPVIRKITDNNMEKDLGLAITRLASAVYITTSNLGTPTVSIKASDGISEYDYGDHEGVIYASDSPVIKASCSVIGTGFTYGNRARVTTLKSDGTPEDPGCDFAWSSSNARIATIDSDGTIHPTGREGEAYFIFSALNGGKTYKDGNGNEIERRVSSKTGKYKFSNTTVPFLSVGDINYIHIASGSSVTIYASSNIPEPITIDVYRGGSVVSGAAIYTMTAPVVTEEDPLSEVQIPGEILTYNYGFNDENYYTVHFHTTYDEYDYEGKAHITVESLPAKVRFGSLEKYFILDTVGTVPISWDITNFAKYSSGNPSDLFELKVTKNGQDVYTINDPGTDCGDGHYTGQYNLTIDPIVSSGSRDGFREIYIVSIKAKNGSDSTWSNDSFVLYVYDEDALKIWVQPTSDIEKQRGAVGTVIEGSGSTDGTLLMKNSAIATMSQDDIIALKRDISLRNVISANYGEYAWTELSDMLEWKSSNNRVATINYKQGKKYEDIRTLSYAEYRPGTDLLVSGLNDGTTTITAKHVMTGMTEDLVVNVETLKDKLYLFQCYPQVETTLTYKDKSGTEKTVTSDEHGAAAIYDVNGIGSDVYCRSVDNGITYLGTFSYSNLESGERDSTSLNLYPCNNVTLRRAAFAYLYIKNPDGTPYNGYVMIRGGVNVNGQYARNALFAYNSHEGASKRGDENNFAYLTSDGKLEIAMDQSQWGLAGGQISKDDKISYEFVISGSDDGQSEGTSVYPMYIYVDAGLSEEAFVGSGEAIVAFRNNTKKGKHPFILDQYVVRTDPRGNVLPRMSVLDESGHVGINDDYPAEDLETIVMWWGEDYYRGNDYKLALSIKNGRESIPVCAGEGQSEQTVSRYSFVQTPITSYTVKLNSTNLNGVLAQKASRSLELKYYRKGNGLTRQEDLSFLITNLVGCGDTTSSATLKDSMRAAGNSTNTSAGATFGKSFGDDFVGMALNVIATMDLPGSDDAPLSLKISPTSDPTKFVGLMKFNYSTMDDPEYNDSNGFELDLVPSLDDLDHTPSFSDMGNMANGSFFEDMANEFSSAVEEGGSVGPELSYEFGGYMETLIYYDYEAGNWAMQILDGGFNAGFGVAFEVNFNVMVGPVPITMSLEIGGQVRISMDSIATDYYNFDESTVAIDNEYLTKLRLYIYIKAFCGVGFDYSVVALKLGIFGQIGFDLQFEWLNRPYMEKHAGQQVVPFATQANWGNSPNLNGQRYIISGMIGLEFVASVAFISYEKVLFSLSHSDDYHENDYDLIEALWANNQTNMRSAIDALMQTNSASMSTMGGQKFVSVDLAPRVETRDYLNDEDIPRVWGNRTNNSAIMKTAKVYGDNKVSIPTIETNTYPYAEPKLIKRNDGKRIYWLSDMNSADVKDTSAVRAQKTSESTQWSLIDGASRGLISSDINDESLKGVGDVQLDVAGDGNFELAAWTRQMVDNGREAGDTLSNVDQMVSLYGTEIFARPSDGTTVRLTENSTPDIAPSVAVRGGHGIVSWRSVAMSGAGGEAGFNVADFNMKDMILFKLYDVSNKTWSNETYCAYNGSSGSVKALKSAMLSNGTAALAYTVDLDGSDVTTEDREIIYSVIDVNGDVIRTVRATNDDVLDENPDITVVKFTENGPESFVLGWYSHKTVENSGQNVSQQAGTNKTVEGDLCILDFDDNGNIVGKLPGSLSRVAGETQVNVTSDFKFASGADTIDTLSITWVERSDGNIRSNNNSSVIVSAEKPEFDILKATKFYTYGTNNENIGLTGVINVAEMPDGTLIDSYDAVQEKVGDEYKINAVILGTTYGANGAVSEKTGVTTGGQEVTYYVPKAVSSMYDVTETYKNKISVPLVYVDSETVKLDSTIGVQFVVRNDGYTPITGLVLKAGNQQTTVDNLVLLPGASATLWADYKVPADAVRDTTYTVTATYASGADTVTGKLTLYRPDLAITSAKIVSEENGQRDIMIKLNNSSDSALSGSDKKVRLRFFADSTLQEEIDEKYISSVTVDDNETLKMIDEGGYSTRVTFDAAAYVAAKKYDKSEIPENGIDIFVSANIYSEEEDIFGNVKLVAENELIVSNNTAKVTCENLKVRTGKDIIISSDMEILDDGREVVNVELQNTKISTKSVGNVIVNLLDENGNIIEEKQSYNDNYAYSGSDNGLVTLEEEGKAVTSFTFAQAGAAITVQYAEFTQNMDATSIESISFSNIPWVSETSFVKVADGEYAAEVTLGEDTETEVTATAAGDTATVSIVCSDDVENAPSESVKTATRTVNLLQKNDGSTVTVTVTVEDGTQKKFVLNVRYSAVTSTESGQSIVPDGNPENTTDPYYEPEITPEPTPTPEPAQEVEKDEKTDKKTDEKVETVKAPTTERKTNAVTMDKKIGMTQKNGKVSLSWGKVKDAEYYEVYLVYDGQSFSKAEPIVVEDASKLSTKKIGGKKIDKTKNLKFKVVAYKTDEDGRKVQLGESLTLYAAGENSKEYTNVSEITLNKTKKSLSLGKTFKLKADIKLQDEKKKLMDSSASELRYESSDTSVAKVSSKGKITTVGKGTCYIYVYALNGTSSKIKITVK